jgi:hypothetical protein
MTKRVNSLVDVLVVGGGLAGVSAACSLAECGLRVRLVDQSLTLGGAVLKQAVHGSDTRLHGIHEPTWRALMAKLERLGDLIEVSLSTAFSGFDSSGSALVVDSLASTHERIQARAVILATGASERIRPRPGWELPGVMTAGALQIIMKTSLRAPQKRVLLAGSGPLLLAVAAQLTKLGQPPIAIMEEAKPFSHFWKGVGLPLSYLLEATGYLATLIKARVPIYQASAVSCIESSSSGLRVTVKRKHDQIHFETDFLALHDGITQNSYGMRPEGDLVWRVAGDCALALGARASAAHGEIVALEVIKTLGGTSIPLHDIGKRERQLEKIIAVEKKSQTLLKNIYWVDDTAAIQALPADTVICRCENKTVGDFKALGVNPTNREIRLLGRFAMGACQGRFCSEWVNLLRGKETREEGAQLVGKHWPVKPISINALTRERVASDT